jgi:hypothetical protein
VDGSLGAWTYILSDLYPLHDAPDLTLGSVYTLLPVVHKYNLTKLITRLTAFVMHEQEELSHKPDKHTNVIMWLVLAERLQLDELRELCLVKLRGMSKQQLQYAITVEVGGGIGELSKWPVRKEVMQGLSRKLLGELLSITAFAS